MVGAHWALPRLLPAMGAQAFTFDPDFLPIGAALTVLLWGAGAVQFAMVFNEGRWRPLTRQLDVALNLGWAGLLLWFILGPRLYLAPATDASAKGALVLVLATVLISASVSAHRLTRRSLGASAAPLA